MKKALFSYFGVLVLLYALVHISSCQQLCAPPDVPYEGAYFPQMKNYEPAEKVTYNCSEGYTLMGEKTSKCKYNGEWSNPTPFCDLKARVKNAYAVNFRGDKYSNLRLTDGDTSTCFSINTGESINMNLDRRGSVYAVRLYLRRGSTNIDIITGERVCSYYGVIDTSQWVLIQCNKKDVSATSVKIQDKSPKNNNSTLCEVEIFVKEDDGCEYPPKTKVPNGHFKVSRTLAKLICEDGYESNSGTIVCEGNRWIESPLQCNEILCSPVLSPNWRIDPVKKISAGTRSKLFCVEGYERTGGPDTIVCQNNGSWTFTNATCAEMDKSKSSTKTIIFAVVGAVVALIIVSLLAVTIYFVKKQRKEVIVFYKQPTEGSIVSGSEADNGSGYYESIQSLPQQLAITGRPTAQMITNSYFTPLDSHDSLKKQPSIPPDLSFDYAVPYETMSG